MENNDDIINLDNQDIGKKISAKPAPEPKIGIDLEDDFIKNIASAYQVSKLDITELNEFLQVSQRRDNLYQLIDAMCEDSTIAAILETYAEDATETNDTGEVVWVDASEPTVGKYIDFLLKSMDINKHAYSWVYSLIKYGDLYLHLYRESDYKEDTLFKDVSKKNTLNEEIKINAYSKNDNYSGYVEKVPNPAEMFELVKLGKSMGYIKADVAQNYSKQRDTINDFYKYSFKRGDINIYDATNFVHATLDDNQNRYKEEVCIYLEDKNKDEYVYDVNRGQSLFYNVFKIWRMISLLENSMLLNRVTKSAIIRLIQVEVGDMDKTMIAPHLQGLKSMIEQKAAVNAGNSMSEYTNPGPIENYIYVPTHNGVGAIQASEIGGDVNVGTSLPDIDYFVNKFFGAMRIPKQYFGLTDDGAGFNGGTSLSIISSRYAKMIKRIQNSFLQAITSVINLFLIDRGFTSYIGKFTLRMQEPTTQEEIDRRENKLGKIQIASDLLNMISGEMTSEENKLELLKSILSSVVDNDIIEIIEKEIKDLESNDSDLDKKDNLDLDVDSSHNSFNNTSLDQSLGLDSEVDDVNIDTEIENQGIDLSDETLPTPEEIGIGDLVDNNNEQI